MPINQIINLDFTRENFKSNRGKPSNLIILDNFIDPVLIEYIYSEVQESSYYQWIAYQDDSSKVIKSKFSENINDLNYISIHNRSKDSIKGIDFLSYLMGREKTINLLKKSTGLNLSIMRDYNSEIFHMMKSGDFIEYHCDFGPKKDRTQLVISLSLTKNWEKSFGGETIFSWDNEIKVLPSFNTAVLFKPHKASMHKVEVLTEVAPPKRYTMTFHYH